MTQEDAVILSGVRTPIGRYGGSLKDVRADDLMDVSIRPGISWPYAHIHYFFLAGATLWLKNNTIRRFLV
jgi:acetyl-CoA acetyltransferase